MRTRRLRIRLLAGFLFFVLAALIAAPFAANAQEEENKVVRVGWFDSTFCYWDSYGRRCGIDYEYQQKISAYTGWTFEYVEESWPNLLQMLIDGEIDLLSDVSYTEERTEQMLFPDLPMGSEAYYIYIKADNQEIAAEDLSTFNGKRIGVNKGSVQEGYLSDWAERNRLDIEIVPLDTTEEASMGLLTRGEIDGFASINTSGAKDRIHAVSRIGSSEFYYAVNKNRPDLLAELNVALSGIQDDDAYFNMRVSAENLIATETNVYLTPKQEEWLKEHGAIRVGYLENYLPFCQADSHTGELTGALKDFLAHAANSLKDTEIQFRTTPFRTAKEALEAMEEGRIDCVFPLNLSSYDADEQGLRLTASAMKTEMNAVMRLSEPKDFSKNDRISFALPSGNVNVETFIKENYPSSRLICYADSNTCYQAVENQEADCVLVSNYRIPSAGDAMEKYSLFSAPTGESMPLSFAVKKDDRELFFILNKTINMTKSEDMDSALASYMRSNQSVSVEQFLSDHWFIVVLVVSAIFFLIIFLLLQKMKAERKTHEQQRLLEEAAKNAELKQTITSLLDNMPGMNYTKDAYSGAYLACNQAFAAYAHKDSPEAVLGLTDEQIFDGKTAAHFIEDDRMALSMDEPYIFFEDVRDAAGNQRQFQTTKLKYTDAAGRLCLLGICQDVTDMVRIQRENVTTKEAYERTRSTGIIYTRIAQTLARGYTYLYYVNLDSEEYIEYRSDENSGMLSEKKRAYHFFEACQLELERIVHPDDLPAVQSALERRNLVKALDRDKSFIMTYRVMAKDEPIYVTMRVSRMEDDERYVIMGVTNVDEQEKHRRAAERMKEEQIVYTRLSALSGDYLCVFIVVPETGRYREFSVTASFQSYPHSKGGMDFFAETRELSKNVIYPEDLNRYLSVFTKENVLAEIKRYGIFTVSYRLLIDGEPRYVQLKAAMVEENQGQRLIVGINDIDAEVRQEEEYVKHLAQARIDANVDTLTGVKNRNAYRIAEERLNNQIAENGALEFAISILDVNDLKKINDTEGHKAGDQYLRSACRFICETFKHSPVFRIGGDEFAVISQGSDYENIDALVARVDAHNAEASVSGGIVIACGMAKREKETGVAQVFERADQRMYDNKNKLKVENNG